MKFTRNASLANSGVAYVDKIVHDAGCIFHKVHTETDIGVDGFIEIVFGGKSTGEIIAVQIKSGLSFVARDEKRYFFKSNQKHLEYWSQYPLPVAGIIFNPKYATAVWTDVTSY